MVLVLAKRVVVVATELTAVVLLGNRVVVITIVVGTGSKPQQPNNNIYLLCYAD